MTANLSHFYIVDDGGYPNLVYAPTEGDEGTFVRFAEAGTSLDSLVQAANAFVQEAGRG